MATVEKLDKSRVKLTIEVSAEDFDTALSDTFIKTRKKYNVPGFRKGKAPRKMIESMYGEGVFFEDAFDALYGAAYSKAVEETNVQPIDSPDIAIDQIGKGETLVFTAEVDVRPEVLLGEYTGIEVSKRAYTVEDAEVDAVIEREREKIARFVDQDRPVENGDQVVLDYSGSVDGELFDGGTAEQQTLVIGSNAFIPGFEEQLVGYAKGEEGDITVTFPEEYHAKELAGKEAVFHVVIHQIQTKELPELDDDFAQDVSEFDTFEAFRADKRRELEERNAERARIDMENEAVGKAVKNATIDVPESMVQRQMDYLMQDLRYKLAMSGLTMEQYVQYTGSNLNAMREEYRSTAEERIRMQLVLEAIYTKEGFEASEEEIDAEIADYCSRNKQDVEEFKKNLQESDKDYFTERVRIDKAVKFMLDKAVYVDAPAEETAENGEAEAAGEANEAEGTEAAEEKE